MMIDIDKEKSKLVELIERRQELKTLIKAQEEVIDTDLNPAIGVQMILLGLTSTTIIDRDNRVWNVVVSEEQRTTLDRLKLLEAGVTNEQLQRSEVKGKPYTKITVREFKQKNEGSNTG